MPTGSGKSLIYWLSGMMLGGVTLVISPLIALMGEQEEKLKAQGVEVLAFHSGGKQNKQIEQLKKFANRSVNPSFIFTSPERMATDGFFEYCIRVRKNDIKLITIDEVHCVSQWGSSFRPFYRRIPDFMQSVFGGDSPKILAMTATLNPKELTDIIREFGIDKSDIVKEQSIMRPEISLKVVKINAEDEKDDDSGRLWDILKIHAAEKTLVYVYRKYNKRSVEDLSQRANTRFGLKSVFFHGDMTLDEKKSIIEKFKKNEVNVVFATNAFGMGIDIPDIRVVIHFSIPESVEQYYQEIGRAARDKEAANAYLLYSNKNIDVKKTYFIDASFPSREKLIEVFSKLTESGNKLQVLPYFNDDDDFQQCLHYFIDCGAVRIVTKGFADLKVLTDIRNQKLADIYNSTKTKLLLRSAKESGMGVPELAEFVYECLVKNEVQATKPLDKRLVIEILDNELSESKLNEIMEAISQQRQYKRGLLDYFVTLIDNFDSSENLHQEIARYLGMDKGYLNQVYSTSKGDKVRSKSEIIIANLLFEHGIDYEYELPLVFANGTSICPDFTIMLSDGSKVFWEHLGMLGLESYDAVWLYKLGLYGGLDAGQLITTYEGVTLNDSALKHIKWLKERV